MAKIDLGELAQVPLDPENIPDYLIRLVQRIDDFMQDFNASFYNITYVEPYAPQELDIFYADGLIWDPGSGAGLYQYRSAAWVAL